MSFDIIDYIVLNWDYIYLRWAAGDLGEMELADLARWLTEQHQTMVLPRSSMPGQSEYPATSFIATIS